MPKDRSNRSASFEARSRASPFPCSSSRRHNGGSSSSSKNPPENPPQSPAAASKEIQEWDDIRCPVCMEHPHNAVLLICTSSNKGCQPFMCDTSYRHSNCLDQYRKTFSTDSSTQESEPEKQQNILCPLCRGEVTGWTVVDPARRYMNSKHRSCSSESCVFSGSYVDLRKHARTEHPAVRPSEADPERQRDWRRLEQQRDIGDLVSTMQSVIGGDDGGRLGMLADEAEAGTDLAYPSITIYFILRVRRPSSTGTDQISGRSVRASSRSRRGRATILWGESLNEVGQSVTVNSNANGDGDRDDENDDAAIDSDGSDEMLTSSTQSRGRRRRQMILEDEEDEEVDEDVEQL